MKRNVVLAVCTAALIMAALAVQSMFKIPQKPNVSPSSANTSYYFTSKAPPSQESSMVTADTKHAEHYLIKSYKGYIAVFKEGEKKPYQVYDRRIDTLPKEDQEKITKGIPKDNYTAVEHQLEQFDC